MGVSTIVPVEETFQINHIADLQGFHSLVHFSIIAAEIELNAEAYGRSVGGSFEIQVVGLLLSVLVGECRAVFLCFNLETLEGSVFLCGSNRTRTYDTPGMNRML